MTGSIYPIRNSIDGIADDADKAQLSAVSGKWLSDLWEYEERELVMESTSISKMDMYDCHAYRVGNICILKIEVQMKSAAANSSTYTKLFNSPWLPMNEITDQRNYGNKTSQTPPYTLLYLKIEADGSVSICSYKGTATYCAVLAYPIKKLADWADEEEEPEE